jgi:Domain of unknown function (DUF397)
VSISRQSRLSASSGKFAGQILLDANKGSAMSSSDPVRRNLAWRKARSSVGNGACVEIAPMDGLVAVRDSKDPRGPILTYTTAEWRAFLGGAKKGKFDTDS